MPSPPAHTSPLPGDVGDLAVVVIDNGHGGTHTGMAFLGEDGQRRFLHLAFHRHLVVGDVPAAGLFGRPQMPRVLANHLLMLLDKVGAANSNAIAYAFGYDGTTRFEPTSGLIRLGSGQIGLSCATFVLALFDTVGAPLVDVTTWTTRDGDDATKATLIDLLRECERRGQIEAGHADRAAAEASHCARFRPEDVLAAATEAPPARPPHAMSTIAVRSEAIRHHVLGAESSPPS